ncbi:peptidyl-prolyl cis-trans isomerase [Marinobacterium sp. YM272]|uniref:peptidylprolyl isomerase n=1 Tax=Marinobacterium sp. YM272 TaxID=3421654 RepID=UPI003D7F9C05
MISKLIRDPLVHFSLIGAALFAAYDQFKSPDAALDQHTIVVDRNALLTFMQYRSTKFQPEQANQRLDTMPAIERDKLIHDYVREEALYRKAQALGMTENDYIIRRRSVQKLEFIAQGVAEQVVSVEPGAVESYFDSHRQDYYEEPSYTFTHVFIKGDPADNAGRASSLLKQLNDQAVGFSSATGFGDRFLYNRNYVERTPDFIASHFGEEFRAQLAQLSPDNEHWQGPIASSHGQHLVMLSEYRSGRVPKLAEVRSRVEQDFRRAQEQQKQELAIQQIVEQYDVEYRL